MVFMLILLLAKLNDLFGFDGLVTRAAFGVQELKQFLECSSVGGVAQERAFSPNANEVLGPEFVEMMRQRGMRNAQLLLDLTNDKTVWVRGEEQLHDP
jgi:hypothetical protein